MSFVTFSTRELPAGEQIDAWRAWYDGLYDLVHPTEAASAFVATSTQWMMNGASVGRVAAPPLRAERTRRLVQRNPIDHWVVAIGTRARSRIAWHDTTLILEPQTPFLASLADPLSSERDADDRLHLYLSRDRFSHLAPTLDVARGAAIEGPLGRLLHDYLVMLDQQLPAIPEADLPRLADAIGAMVAACIAPSPDRLREAADQVQHVRLEQARRTIRRHLHSARLGPDMLCRELGMSRSQLYRLFEHEGGVVRYIQRCRLMAVQAALTDPAGARPIAAIAEAHGFYDPSAFSRAFRREFGMSPGEARSFGMPVARRAHALPGPRLTDCFRAA